MFNQYDSFSGFANHYTLQIFSLGLFLAKFPPTCFSTFQALRFFSSVFLLLSRGGIFPPFSFLAGEKQFTLSWGKRSQKSDGLRSKYFR